jgi:ferritin-like metal-binding protein YciE
MIKNLEQLYYDQLRDLYSAESQLVAALPDLTRHASDDQLRKAMNGHLGQTRSQRARLQDLFSNHGLNPGGEDCESMRGMIREAKKHVDHTVAGPVRDAVLIAALNRIEHYEIAGYGVARAFAECLGFEDDAHLLLQSLTEESEADETLTDIATGGIFRRGINKAAAA